MKHEDTIYCDCIDTKFDDTTIEQLKSDEIRQLIPQPDPDCLKCKGTGYIIEDK